MHKQDVRRVMPGKKNIRNSKGRDYAQTGRRGDVTMHKQDVGT